MTVAPSSLTFTSANWNSRQTVTVNAPQDTDHNYDTAILTHTATSTDPNYSGIPVDSVDVSVFDDDVTVMFGEAAYEVKEGEKLELPVTLSAALDINARMPLRSAFQGGATRSDFLGGGTAIFERGDTSTTISFTAVDDVIDDDDESVLFSFFTEQFLARGVSVGTPATTTVSIIDDDEPLGVTVSPTALTVGEGGMGTYTVKLDAGIDGSFGNTVTVAINSSNTNVTVSPSSLTFTGGSMSNWNIEQTVTVTAAEDDDAADDTANLTHRPSGGGYGSGQNKTFVVTVTDDDTRGVTVTPTSLTVDEDSTNTYTVVLDTQPTGTVTVTIVDPTDNTDVTANPASLTFSTSNWSTAQTVTVSAAEDDDAANDTATVTHSVSGGDYGSVTAADVGVTVTDNDTPGVTASPTSLTIGEGTAFNTYTVVLNTQPSGQVTVAISSDNTDVTSSPSSLTFTTSNWNSAQTVTVSAGFRMTMQRTTRRP